MQRPIQGRTKRVVPARRGWNTGVNQSLSNRSTGRSNSLKIIITLTNNLYTSRCSRTYSCLYPSNSPFFTDSVRESSDFDQRDELERKLGIESFNFIDHFDHGKSRQGYLFNVRPVSYLSMNMISPVVAQN